MCLQGRAFGTQPLDLRHGLTQSAQPVVGVLPDQAHAPGEGLGTGSGDAGIHKGVENLALTLAQPGHRGNGKVREEPARLADSGTPGNAAAELGLRLVGDLHPLLAGVLAPTGDPPLGCRRLATLWRRQLADNRDLVTVDRDAQVAGEPTVGDPPDEPGRCVAGIGQVSLLPTARTTERSTSAGPTAATTSAWPEGSVVFVFHTQLL